MHIAIISEREESLSCVGNPSVASRLWRLGETLQRADLCVTHLVVENQNSQRENVQIPTNVHCVQKENFSDRLNDLKCDAVIVRNIYLLDMITKRSMPVIIDLAADMMNIASISLDLSLQIRVIAALRRGDFFICSSEQEKWFFMSWLQQTGFRYSPELIQVIPDFYASKQVASKKEKKLAFAAYKTVSKNGDIYGLTAFIDALHGVDAPLYFVNSTAEKTNIFKKSSVGVALSENNIEAQMNIPYEAAQFLCEGLPLICSKGTACGTIVEQYNAGWTVDVNNVSEIIALIKKLNDTPELLVTAAENALQLVKEKSTDTRAVQSLITFCQKPVKHTDKTDGLLSNLIDYSEKALNLNNPLLNDLYIEEILLFHSSSWQHLEECLEAIDILFPMSNVTVLCPINTLVEEPLIAPHCTLIIYEGDVFDPQMVVETLESSSDTRFDLGIALFNNRFGEGHDPVKKSLLASGAKYKVGFSIDEKFIMLEDSIEKAISDVFDNVAGMPGFNNFS